MPIDLKKYLTEQYHKSISSDRAPGPVVTISRQYGCSAKDFAMLLANKLNEIKKGKKEWNWINKEVFENTAKDLKLKESRIQHVFEGEKKGMIENIILSSSEKYYTSDEKIKKKIIEIVRSFAEQGNTIIIGLGGVAITRDIKKSLHVRLQAPFEWRVAQAAKKRDRTIAEMTKYATSIDKKRDKFRDYFASNTDPREMFDITFNTMTMNQEDIIETIVCLMKRRKMI